MKELGSLRMNLTLGLIVTLAAGAAGADVPRLIHYQGKLRSTAGAAVNDAVSLRFRLYGHVTQASPVLLDESHGSVAVTDGLFNVLIGGATVGGVPDSAIDSPNVYIGIVVNGGNELAPRTPLASTGYALKARSAEQLVRPGSFESAVAVDLNGNVGVGTAAPGEKLEVDGNIKLAGGSPTYKMTNVATPTDDSDVATKAYVDASGGGTYDECYGTCQNQTLTPSCDAGYTRAAILAAGQGCQTGHIWLAAAGGSWTVSQIGLPQIESGCSYYKAIFPPGSARPGSVVFACNNCGTNNTIYDTSCAVCCK